MKQLYLLACSIFTFQAAFSQFSITADNIPVIGDKHSLISCDTTGVQPGPSGNGVTWDFSNLTPNGDSSYYEVIAPSATDFAAQFPNATTAQLDLSENYSFFEVTSNAYNYYGSVSDDGQGGKLVYAYTDPAKYFDFPMSFNATSTDDLAAGYNTSGLNFDRTGTITTTYDGFGTVITPEGTFSNVARLKIVEDNDDVASAGGFPINIDTDITTYLWVLAGESQPVMTISHVTVVASGVVTKAKLVSYKKGSGSVGINKVEDVAELVYPNPTSKSLSLQLPNKASHIQLYDLTGKRTNVILENNKKNDISELPNGMYILQYMQEGNLNTMKVVKQ